MKNSIFIQKLAILLALCLLTLIYLIKTGSNYLFLLDAPHHKSISGVVLLYELYSGREFIIFNFIVLLAIPFISNFKSCMYGITGFDRMIVSRIGRNNYYKNCVIKSIKDIWYFPIIINIFLLIMIHIFYVPIFGPNVKEYGMYFFNSDVINIFFITFIQIIGWSLLNIICFVFSQIIKNKFAYPFALLIFTIALTLFLAIVASIVPYDFILAIFTPFTLLTSGMMGLWYIQPGLSMIIIVFLSLGIFGILILITLKLLLKDGEIYVKKLC